MHAFKNGMYHVYAAVLGAVNVDRNQAVKYLNHYSDARILAYYRTGMNELWYFIEKINNAAVSLQYDIDFDSVHAAEMYVWERGWDEDGLTAFPINSYAIVRQTLGVPPTIPSPPALSSAGKVAASQLPQFSNWDFLFKNGERFTDKPAVPKCDCGGDKCKLPHFRWCSMFKE